MIWVLSDAISVMYSWARSATFSPSTVKIQVEPENRARSAFSIPECSLPDMGWPPRKREFALAPKTERARLTISTFVLPTSVSKVVRGSVGPRFSIESIIPPTLAARITTSLPTQARAGFSMPASMAPISSALARTRCLSEPITRRPLCRKVSPSEPPMSPVPTMVTCLII